MYVNTHGFIAALIANGPQTEARMTLADITVPENACADWCAVTGESAETWHALLEKALWRGSYVMLDSLGIPTADLPRPPGWGTVLAMLTGEVT